MRLLTKQPAFELDQIVATAALWPRLGRRDAAGRIPHAPRQPRVGDHSRVLILASGVPARRAMRVDPMVALRYE